MHSCLYEGHVSHRRYSPVDHHFTYGIAMAYLDLGELPQLLSRPRILSPRRYAWASFDRDVHLMGWDGPLEDAARNLVKDRSGRRPEGPIRLLTLLRSFGYYFSPLNLYYCFDARDRSVEAVIAEVNNTPWKEQHCYVLWQTDRTGEQNDLRFSHGKDFHVSPFMGMDVDYHWRISHPSSKLVARIENTRQGQPFFESTLSLERKPLSRAGLYCAAWRYPLMPARITAAIYWQALKLWWKKCPFYSHPKKLNDSISPSPPARSSRH